MKRIVAVYATLTAIVVSLVMALPGQDRPSPVEAMQTHTDSVWAEVEHDAPEWHRRPVWLVRDLEPLDVPEAEATKLLEDAKSCVLHAGEGVKDDVEVEFWTYSHLVFVGAAGATGNYLGLTVEVDGVTFVLVTNDEHYHESTLRHEAAHAVCDDYCPHNRTTVAERCERELP